MTSKQIVDFGKPFSQYILTAIFAAIGAYLGMKITIAEMKKDIETNKRDVTEIKHEAEIYQNSVFELQKDCQFIKGRLDIKTTRGLN